jgi:hypothetical protein
MPSSEEYHIRCIGSNPKPDFPLSQLLLAYTGLFNPSSTDNYKSDEVTTQPKSA